LNYPAGILCIGEHRNPRETVDVPSESLRIIKFLTKIIASCVINNLTLLA
jgi:hypothetical protein